MAEPWNSFAAREPYFAVLTQPRFLRANFDAAAETEFFETGERLVSDIYDAIREHVVDRFTPATVLEYGCGAGRLLLPFSKRAPSVTGVDIAPAMLEVARSHIEKAGARNIELMTAEAFANDTRKFELVNCYLVLQRLPQDEGLALLRELASRVTSGGACVFHVPYRSNVKPLVALTRAARTRVPGVNALINLARRKPASLSFIASNAYDMNEVLAVLQESGFDSPHLVFERHGELDTVLMLAQRGAGVPPAPAGHPARPSEAPRETRDAGERDARPPLIDVKELIARSSIDDLNRTAEEYFASLKWWEDHLAKPFSRADDAPQLLINFAVLIQGLQLAGGMRVLEFGAGTGWLSRFLTQLECEAILLDVSPTALRIARELYERQPVIGDRPQPQFLVFDGRKIDLPDESVDRIVCFDAFHHSPNPEQVLREFARVLKPGGIAAFAEPGPEHSKTAQSQYEMRTYGVLENDIDIHALWAAAQQAGFAELKLAAFNVMPFHMALWEYDELLAGGATFVKWAEQTRAFMKNVRDFFLIKSGTEEADSRRKEGLHAAIEATPCGVGLRPASEGRPEAHTTRVRVTVRNTGRARWLPSSEIHGGVSLGAHLYEENGRLLDHEYSRHPLPRALAPGEDVTFEIELPPLEPGRYTVELDCVANKVTWFGQAGSTPARIELHSPLAT